MLKLIQDRYGRRFRTLRLSLTEHCNFQCLYCVPAQKHSLAKAKFLAPQRYVEYVRQIHAISPLDTVRLTGGEPTLYPWLPDLVARLKELPIRRLSMTSNGLKLGALAGKLKSAGLDSINVSIDAVQAEILQKMSRHAKAEKALEGISLAKKAGLELKVNCTVWRGINHCEIAEVLEYFGTQGITVRYLELMNMGHLYKEYKQYLYSQAEILADLALRYRFSPLRRKASSTASYWRTTEGWLFGIIANHSQPFCSDCDRLRLDSQGKLYGCLSNAQSIAFPEHPDDLAEALKQALEQKQPGSSHFQGSQLSMQALGG